MTQKRIRNYLALIVVILIVYIFVSALNISFSERGAIKKYPFPFGIKGDIIYEQQYDGKKIVVVEGPQYNSVYVVKSYIHFLHRVIDSNYLVHYDPEATLLRTWGGSLNDNKLYDTLIAVQALDKAIVKVIVSNEDYQEEFSDNIGEIIANATFYEVLTIKDGFATYYGKLEPSLVGGYIFRGLNAQGEIIAVLR